MARGSKVFLSSDVPEGSVSTYPAEFRPSQRKRHYRRLGDFGGLKNFGVNLVRVEPGGISSARHAHSKQDELVHMLSGELVLVTDAGEETIRPGMFVAFPAGTGNGHQFVNRSSSEATFLVVGDRTPGDEVSYPDIDLAWKRAADGSGAYYRKDGTPYSYLAPD